MMISPETFYQNELAGKSEQQIMTVIRRLKRQINQVIKKTERLDEQDPAEVYFPLPATRVWALRGYLDRAILALQEIGVEYQPSTAEKRSLEFQDRISQITNITFSIGGFFSGDTVRTAEIGENEILLHYSTSIKGEYKVDRIAKQKWLNSLATERIGEWKAHYYNPNILDGTQWDLVIEYSDGKKKVFDGSNAFPFNFDSIKDLFDITDEEQME